MTAYYNEIDPYAAQWLRNLIKAGHIAPGDVDERSIADVSPNDLKEYTQCHFFAGVGVWSLALRKAGWPDDKPVWTGSCPCQPFSTAGQGAGFADERHLWPAWYHLITQCEPSRIFGEQVASKDALAWLDLVQTDLEGAGYASGAIDLCSAGVGAPHIRQRHWFVAERLAHTSGQGSPEQRGQRDEPERPTETGLPVRLADTQSKRRDGVEDTAEQAGRVSAETGGAVVGMADTANVGCNKGRERKSEAGSDGATRDSTTSRMADSDGKSARRYCGSSLRKEKEINGAEESDDNRLANDVRTVSAGPTNGLWADADWLLCRDGKFRPVEPGTFPLANGAPSRVGRLRAYGNAINAKAAEEFIKAYMECRP